MKSSTNAALAQLTAMLLELTSSSGSDAAKIAAAKLLLDRMSPKKTHDALPRRNAARAAAIKEAEALLAQLAAAKSAGAGEPVALAEQRAGGADDAAALVPARTKRRR